MGEHGDARVGQQRLTGSPLGDQVQVAHAVMLVPPAAFACNPATARSNRFQQRTPPGPVYQTNGLLAVGPRVAIVCRGALVPRARCRVLAALADGGRDGITINAVQMAAFAGSCLELAGRGGPCRAQSARGAGEPGSGPAATPGALCSPGRHAGPTIETGGGGSVCCRLAGIFLPGPGVIGARLAELCQQWPRRPARFATLRTPFPWIPS